MFKVNPLDGNAKKDGQDAGALGSDNAKHRPGLGKTPSAIWPSASPTASSAAATMTTTVVTKTNRSRGTRPTEADVHVGFGWHRFTA